MAHYNWKEGNVLFNDALNTFYLRLDIWYRTTEIVIQETCCSHMDYSFQLAARVILYASSHRQDNTYHSLCDTVMEHWLEQEIAQWVHHEGSIQ